MVTIEDIIQFVRDAVGLLAVLGIAIEAAPIKINPFSWIGQRLNSDIKRELTDLKSDFEKTRANGMRWEILNFANSCRRGTAHSKDEWRHTLDVMTEYEKYTEAKKISNGVIEEDSKFLRDLYQERNYKNDFFIGGSIHGSANNNQ